MLKRVVRKVGSDKLTDCFFKELKHYNPNNFNTLLKTDLPDYENPVLHKAFSSVITRYFIFAEKHPEIIEADLRLLYYQLRIDMIARYFSEYPECALSDLEPFQTELRRYVERSKRDLELQQMKKVANG